MLAAEAVASKPNAPSTAQGSLESAVSLYSNISSRLEDLKIAERLATGTGSLLASGTVDPVPVSPKPVRNAALGLALGLFVGLGVVFLAEQFDTRIASAAEAGTIYGAPVLANIPIEAFGEAGQRVAILERPGSPTAEAYRVLRNNLDFVNIDNNTKVVLVTSALQSEGKSTAAANLATALGQTGKKVVLVGCDFHKPTTDVFFDLTNSYGLSDVLLGKMDGTSAAQRIRGSDGLWVLPAGSMPPNPSALLGSQAMGAVLAGLSESFDWVILDAPPVLASADATALVRWVDGVLSPGSSGRVETR